MINMCLTKTAAAVNGNLSGNDINFYGCSTDTRDLQQGNLFIALKGENFDGHDYIAIAEEKGASSLMLEHASIQSLPTIKVADTRRSMGLLAQSWRKEMQLPVVAITGSNGKTTVKEMVTRILSEIAEVHATSGNFNNDIGVPLTLFGLDKKHQYAVIEMGANHLGEIEWLSAIAQPDVAVITQCAPAHLEGFGSIEGVAKAKAEIYSGLRENGTAIINADDDYADFWREVCRDKSIQTFAIDSTQADVHATNIEILVDDAATRFDLVCAQGNISVQLPLSGKHNVMNALAATACCLSLDIGLPVIKQGLEKMAPVKGRLQIKQGMQGARIIDDTYNANPTSLAVALNVLSRYPGKRYLVLGDMGELGETSAQLHIDAGSNAKQMNIDGLFAVGDLSKHAVQRFGDGAYHFTQHDDLTDAIKSIMTNTTTILVKGSRSMKMEHIVNALLEEQV